jgi:hypothetical protein
LLTKRRTLYHHVRTAKYSEKIKDTLVNHKKVVKKENSTAMSGEDLQCQVISSKIIRIVRAIQSIEGF